MDCDKVLKMLKDIQYLATLARIAIAEGNSLTCYDILGFIRHDTFTLQNELASVSATLLKVNHE